MTDDLYPCREGHYDCATRDRGPCADELRSKRVREIATEILRRKNPTCSCGAPEQGHAPDCSYICAEEDAWETALEREFEERTS
jgi:hypothetical protein